MRLPPRAVPLALGFNSCLHEEADCASLFEANQSVPSSQQTLKPVTSVEEKQSAALPSAKECTLASDDLQLNPSEDLQSNPSDDLQSNPSEDPNSFSETEECENVRAETDKTIDVERSDSDSNAKADAQQAVDPCKKQPEVCLSDYKRNGPPGSIPLLADEQTHLLEENTIHEPESARSEHISPTVLPTWQLAIWFLALLLWMIMLEKK